VLEGTASSVAKKSSCLLLHQQGVCHTVVALPFILKSISRQKEELWKLKYFAMQKYILHKNL
jgi:hypothetical protein